MDFIDQLIAFGKAKTEQADEKFKQYGIYGPNGPLGSLGQQQMKLEYNNEAPGGYEPKDTRTEPKPVPIPNAEYPGKSDKRRMYVRNDDGTFDLMDVELDENGNPVTLRRVFKGPEGPINV